MTLIFHIIRHIGMMYARARIDHYSKSLQEHHESHKQALVSITKTYPSLFLAKCPAIGVTLRTVSLEMPFGAKTSSQW